MGSRIQGVTSADGSQPNAFAPQSSRVMTMSARLDSAINVRFSPESRFALRRPPYSREILSARRAGAPLNVHVQIGSQAWRRAKKWGFGTRMVVPLTFDRSPEHYDFSVLEGLSVTLNAIDADLILARRTAVAIVEAGARLVALLHPQAQLHCEFIYGVES
jgi:hypothetical protein